MTDRLRYVADHARDALLRATDAYAHHAPTVLHPLARTRVETYDDPYNRPPSGEPQPGTLMPRTTSPRPRPPDPGDVEGRRMCTAYRRAVAKCVDRLLAAPGWPTTVDPVDPHHASDTEVTSAARWAAACLGLVAHHHDRLDGGEHAAVRRKLLDAAKHARQALEAWDRVPPDVAERGSSAVQRHLDQSGTAVQPPRWWPGSRQPRCTDCGYRLAKARGWCATCYEQRRANGWQRKRRAS